MLVEGIVLVEAEGMVLVEVMGIVLAAKDRARLLF